MIPKASPKVVSKIQEQAETFINLARKKFEIDLDYSEESLVIVDDLITIFFKIHREHFIKATVLTGSYLGEVITKNLGGKWLKDLSMTKIGNLKSTAHPMTRAKKRLANGTDDSLVYYYRNLKLTSSRNSVFAPDKEKIKNFRKIITNNDWDIVLLNRMLDEDEPRYVREEAAELLGRIARENIDDSLVKAAKNPETVYYAAIALQGHPVQNANSHLIKNLKRDLDISVKQQILLALGKIGLPETLDEIIPYLADEDEIIGHYAAMAIGKIGTQAAVDKLLAIMAGLHPGQRTHAITALEVMGSQEAVPAIIEALFSNDEEVRESAARALQYIPDERAFKPLAYCLQDKSSRIRIFAAYALSNIGDLEALPYINKLLLDDVKNVRLHAAHLVKWLKTGGKPEAKVI